MHTPKENIAFCNKRYNQDCSKTVEEMLFKKIEKLQIPMNRMDSL
jgi:hypothetical protein